MPLKFTDQIQSIVSNNASRVRNRGKRNQSLKIEKLYSSTFSTPTSLEPFFLGLENGNILGSESSVGLGIENQP